MLRKNSPTALGAPQTARSHSGVPCRRTRRKCTNGQLPVTRGPVATVCARAVAIRAAACKQGPPLKRSRLAAIEFILGGSRPFVKWQCNQFWALSLHLSALHAAALGSGSVGVRYTRHARGDHIEDALDALLVPPLFECLLAQELGLDGDPFTQISAHALKRRGVQ
jgi:hypothetical protein